MITPGANGWIFGQTDEDIKRAARDGFFAIRDGGGHLLMRYNIAKNLIEIQRRGNMTVIDLSKCQQRSDMSADANSLLLESNIKPSRHDIDILSQSSPIINGALMYYRYEQLSYEEALILMVVTQNKIIDMLNKNFIEYKSNNPYPDKSATSAATQGGADGRLTND